MYQYIHGTGWSDFNNSSDNSTLCSLCGVESTSYSKKIWIIRRSVVSAGKFCVKSAPLIVPQKSDDFFSHHLPFSCRQKIDDLLAQKPDDLFCHKPL